MATNGPSNWTYPPVGFHKRRQDPKPVAAKLLFMEENYKEVVQKRVAFLKQGDKWSSSQSGQEKGVVKQGMTSGSQMAKIGEQLKRDLKQQPTRQLSSTPARYDSDDTCCDIFYPPKKRKMAIDTSVEEEDAIPQAESQRPGTVPAIFVELDEDSLKALKELPGLVFSLKTVLNKIEDFMISSQSQSLCTGSQTGIEDDMVSLGNSLVQVPKRLYQRLSGRRMSLFTQELATLVFGRETLAKATLTGKGKKGELKEQLEPEKTNAIIDAVRERFPNTEVAEIRALLRRKCNNESYKASSNSSLDMHV
ncbi:uncharacterized protein [Pseudorasbora parva]|uniref:uncharacterized protein n=1 Tax=Pseudorasbora parva TaxID=51549 RepID=UPI00351EEB6E